MKITVFGCCGSGKTYFSKKLQSVLKIPLISLDSIYWLQNWKHISEDAFLTRMELEIKKDNWIIEGLYHKSIETRIENSDIIIYLDIPSRICFFNVLKRELIFCRKSRIGMPSGCKERIDIPFLKCIWLYDRKYRIKYLKKLNSIKDKKVVILHSYKECNDWLRRLSHSVV